jgi:hypothetical protein
VAISVSFLFHSVVCCINALAAIGIEVRKIGSEDERKKVSFPFSDLLLFLTS